MRTLQEALEADRKHPSRKEWEAKNILKQVKHILEEQAADIKSPTDLLLYILLVCATIAVVWKLATE